MARFPMPGVDYRHPLTLPKMTLPAHGVWRWAHERGLVSDVEFERYEALVDSHPCSWKGWLRWSVGRPWNGGL